MTLSGGRLRNASSREDVGAGRCRPAREPSHAARRRLNPAPTHRYREVSAGAVPNSGAILVTVSGEHGVHAGLRPRTHWGQPWEGARRAATREPGDRPERVARAVAQGLAKATETISLSDEPSGRGRCGRAPATPGVSVIDAWPAVFTVSRSCRIDCPGIVSPCSCLVAGFVSPVVVRLSWACPARRRPRPIRPYRPPTPPEKPLWLPRRGRATGCRFPRSVRR